MMASPATSRADTEMVPPAGVNFTALEIRLSLDVKCGRAIGANVLAVATGGATLDELKQHAPDWAVADLRQLSANEICRRT
jgi:hypothetical protein